jgi:hypothetical protein
MIINTEISYFVQFVNWYKPEVKINLVSYFGGVDFNQESINTYKRTFKKS